MSHAGRDGVRGSLLLAAVAAAAGLLPLRFAAADPSPLTSTAAPAPFMMCSDVTNVRIYEYHRRVYTEAFRRLGVPITFAAYSLTRRAALAEEGTIDGELARVRAYGDAHPRRRYGRADFGTGPVRGVACAGDALTCSNDGFVSPVAWGYRVRAAASFRPGDGVRIAPSLAFGHDVRGWSYDGNLLEGRLTATLALRAEYGRTFTELSWSPIWGGDYNALKDRSWASAFLGVRL